MAFDSLISGGTLICALYVEMVARVFPTKILLPWLLQVSRLCAAVWPGGEASSPAFLVLPVEGLCVYAGHGQVCHPGLRCLWSHLQHCWGKYYMYYTGAIINTFKYAPNAMKKEGQIFLHIYYRIHLDSRNIFLTLM